MLETRGARVDTVTYRIWCQDGPRHDAVPEHRLPALVQAGHLDLEDRVAPQGTEDWMPAWSFQGLFEPCVVQALQRNAHVCDRMARSIKGGWLSLIEYRQQRDRLLELEPGVRDSDWVRRPRPDLARAGVTPVLRKAADEGAAAEREAELARLRAQRAQRERAHDAPRRDAAPLPLPTEPSTPVPDAPPSMRALRQNMERLLEGDLSGSIDPMLVVQAWRRRGLRNACIAIALALALDPLQPSMHAQQWWLIALAVASVACLLLQFASPGRGSAWSSRFAACLLACVLTAALLVTGVQVDMQHGLLAHWSPKVADWQRSLQPAS
jgi:hypothetical protein